MATISGLPAPNPYAPSAAKPKLAAASANVSPAVVSLPDRATLNHAAFTPDWMQDHHVAQATVVASGVYSQKGALQKLPESVSTASERGQQEAVVQDIVDFSSEYAVSPGSGKT